MIELLQDKRITDREYLLMLLSSLANGTSYHAVQSNILSPKSPETLEREKQEEIQWVRNAHDAVQQGTPIYLSLLDNRRPNVRTAAAHLLSCFPEIARDIVPQIRSFLVSEKNHDVRASLMLCLGVLSDPDIAVHSLFEAALRSRSNDPQRLAAAISLIWRDREKASQEAVTILQNALADPENFPEAFVFSVWDIDADPGLALYDVIDSLGRDRAVETMIELLGKMEEPIDPLVDSLIETAFEEHQGKTITSEMLTPLQRNALAALLTADAVWDQKQEWQTHSIGTREWQYGLPIHRAEVEQFLRGDNG